MSARALLCAAAGLLAACGPASQSSDAPSLHALPMLEDSESCTFPIHGHDVLCRKVARENVSRVFAYEELLIADGWRPVQPGYGASLIPGPKEYAADVLWFERPTVACSQKMSLEMAPVEEIVGPERKVETFYYFVMIDDYAPVCADQKHDK